MSGDDTCPSPRAPARGTVFRPFPTGESPRPIVYRENVLPSTMNQSINSLSSSLSIPIFQQSNSVNGWIVYA